LETEVLTTEENAFDELDFDESVELRALVRSLKRARNFTLLFARCNQRPRQRELIEQIKNELSDKNIEVVYFDNEVSHFLDELKERLEGKTPDAVFVYGLENSLGSSVTSDKTRFVLSLNVSRNNFPQVVNCPIVFWLPDYGIKAFANGAPDFFSVRSGVYFFDTKESDVNQIEKLISEDYYESAALSFNERKERISHILELLSEYESLSKNERDKETEMKLKIKLAQLLTISAQYDKAIEINKVLFAELDKKKDLNFKSSILTNIAELYRLQRRYKEAEQLIKEASFINEQFFGENHPNTANSYNNLALLYRLQDNYEEAETLFIKALRICEQFSEGNHHLIPTIYNNLANLYYLQGKYEKAELFHKNALRIREQILGKKHPDTANSYNNLAFLYESQGKYKEAEKLYKKALRITERVLGKEHPYTLTVRKNLETFKDEINSSNN
jgi:tetratricopeptide (TPR) repeat protein